jgi:gliding motility-associated-like protein
VATEGIDSVCIGGSDTLLATGAATYQWQADPTLTGANTADPIVTPTVTDIYYVTGTDSLGCKKKDSVLVYVYLPPTPGIGPDTAYICQGKPVQLLATGGVDYTWVANSTLSPLNVANPIATPTDTTSYYVTVYNIHQCHANDTIQINVQIPVQAEAQSPYNICIGGSVRLTSSGGFYYQWTPPQWLSGTTVSDPLSKPDSSIVYTVKVSNNCFSDTANVDVIVHPLPIVNAGDDTTIFRNTPVTLSGTTNGVSYAWSPADNIQDPSSLTTPATPLHTTQYYLYVTSEFGCVNLDSVLVSVDPYVLLLIPSAFTPNGDGLDDIFHIVRYLNIETLEEFAVYDRWGQKVFSTDILTDGWNGTYKGHPQDMGVYVWYVKALTYDGQEVFRKGNVTLIR